MNFWSFIRMPCLIPLLNSNLVQSWLSRICLAIANYNIWLLGNESNLLIKLSSWSTAFMGCWCPHATSVFPCLSIIMLLPLAMCAWLGFGFVLFSPISLDLNMELPQGQTGSVGTSVASAEQVNIRFSWNRCFLEKSGVRINASVGQNRLDKL